MGSQGTLDSQKLLALRVPKVVYCINFLKWNRSECNRLNDSQINFIFKVYSQPAAPTPRFDFAAGFSGAERSPVRPVPAGGAGPDPLPSSGVLPVGAQGSSLTCTAGGTWGTVLSYVYCILCSVRCTVYLPHSAVQCTSHCTLCRVKCKLYTVYLLFTAVYT